MSLKEQLKSDLKEAMRNKEIVKRDCIRSINTMIKQIEVDERRELNDEEVVKLIQKGIKQREEASAQFKDAKRDDLVAKENEEIEVFSLYLPKQLSEEELRVEVQNIIDEVGATSMKDMGKIMGVASKRLAGVTDGKKINECVKSILG